MSGFANFFGLRGGSGNNSREQQRSSGSSNHQRPAARGLSRRSTASTRTNNRHEERLEYRDWQTRQLVNAGGVAIFHLATSRVVICRHSREGHWFLPKGRRDPNEESRMGAEREGYEESGYRNRILPLPIPHRQPAPHNVSDPQSPYVTEPIYTQLMPVRNNVSYLLNWYIAETLPPQLEGTLNEAMHARSTRDNPTPYIAPPTFPLGPTLSERIDEDWIRDSSRDNGRHRDNGRNRDSQSLDGSRDQAYNRGHDNRNRETIYEPLKHEGTGVDSDEMHYESHLLDIEEACFVLRGTAMEYVVRFGWECVQARMEQERAVDLEKHDLRVEYERAAEKVGTGVGTGTRSLALR